MIISLTHALILPVMLFSASSCAQLVVVSHDPLPKLSHNTVARIYTGRVIKIDDVFVIPVNTTYGDPLRGKFLKTYLKQNEDKYSAYWTVRRFIGKGTPPKEVASEAAMVDFIRSTPNSIGYIDTENISVPDDLYVLSE